ncbi:hypothetical protein AB0442_36425 [Kitasatospora sp. NPDC085895]|uniref:hypothetical protein n=1 Tax=Kitasatospora sp. NPDC085895 TaxID=3155057 RepID=UPI00344ED4F4
MEPRFHQGDAKVHAGADLYRCRANLRCWTDQISNGTSLYPGLQQWAGHLHFDSDADAETVLYAAAPYLVVDDSEAAFLVEDLDRPTATLAIRGNGPAPF